MRNIATTPHFLRWTRKCIKSKMIAKCHHVINIPDTKSSLETSPFLVWCHISKWPMISSHSRIQWDYQLCFSSNSWKAEIVDWTNSNNLVFFFLLLLLFTSACGLFATWRRGSTFPLGGHLQQTHEKDDWLGRAWREFMSKKKIYKTTQRKIKIYDPRCLL